MKEKLIKVLRKALSEVQTAEKIHLRGDFFFITATHKEQYFTVGVALRGQKCFVFLNDKEMIEEEIESTEYKELERLIVGKYSSLAPNLKEKTIKLIEGYLND